MTEPTDTNRSAPTSTAGDRIDRLVQIMRTLRSPDGCAWDREQTLASLRPFVLEEAYEVVDAIDRGDRTALRDEIGDLLLEAVFVAQICAEAGDFTLSDAADAVVAKLIRRHPHVFGGGDIDTDAGRRRPLPRCGQGTVGTDQDPRTCRDARARDAARRYPRGVAVPAAGVADRRAHRERRLRLG